MKENKDELQQMKDNESNKDSKKEYKQQIKKEIKEQKRLFQGPEGELTNVIISILVSLSLLLFPIPIWGIFAIASWLLYFLVAYKRGYGRNSLVIIGTVLLVITAYQISVTPPYIYHRNLTTNLVVVIPENHSEGATSHEIDITVTNDNVKSIYYQFQRGRSFEADEFMSLDASCIELNETCTVTLEEREGGSYTLILRVELHEGDVSPVIYFGRYLLLSN